MDCCRPPGHIALHPGSKVPTLSTLPLSNPCEGQILLLLNDYANNIDLIPEGVNNYSFFVQNKTKKTEKTFTKRSTVAPSSRQFTYILYVVGFQTTMPTKSVFLGFLLGLMTILSQLLKSTIRYKNGYKWGGFVPMARGRIVPATKAWALDGWGTSYCLESPVIKNIGLNLYPLL